MPHVSHDFLKQLKSQSGRLLGLDIGSKTLGLALSDRSWLIATPGVTLKRGKLAVMLDDLRAFIQGEKVTGLVVGLPKNKDGSDDNASSQRVKDFMTSLDSVFPHPYVFWDERLTTKEAQGILKQTYASHTKRKKHVDAIAASLILQGFLDYAGMS